MQQSLWIFPIFILGFLVSIEAADFGDLPPIDLGQIVRLLDPKGRLKTRDVIGSLRTMVTEANDVLNSKGSNAFGPPPDQDEIQLELNNVFESRTFGNLIDQAMAFSKEMDTLKVRNSNVATQLAQVRRIFNNPSLDAEAIKSQLETLDFTSLLSKNIRRENKLGQMAGRFGSLLEGMQTMQRAIDNPDGISGLFKSMFDNSINDNEVNQERGESGFGSGNGGRGQGQRKGRNNGNALTAIGNALSGDTNRCRQKSCKTMVGLLDGLKGLFSSSSSGK